MTHEKYPTHKRRHVRSIPLTSLYTCEVAYSQDETHEMYNTNKMRHMRSILLTRWDKSEVSYSQDETHEQYPLHDDT